MRLFLLAFPVLPQLACTDSGSDSAAPALSEPQLGELIQVVPSDGLPAEVVVQPSANNLDVTWHEGRAFLAFRTAPSHFASTETVLYVVSSDDQVSWEHELSIAMGTDLREPRLLSWGGELLLYYAVLGESSFSFEPQGTMRVVRGADGSWSEPAWWREDSFIPWRIHVLDGVPMMTGYTGGGEIYDLEEGEYPSIQVYWLSSSDGYDWQPHLGGDGIVWEGGASETDLAFTPDGDVVAVMRNEAGDADGFGSLICKGLAGSLGDWSCSRDDRKYDSPLVFEDRGRIWLIGRRNVTETGAYDLGYDDRSFTEQYLAYQGDYWQQPKRCSLWEVDPDSLTVDFVLDLPSKGDTCFASTLAEGDGGYTVYNYSNDPDGPELSWLEGQTAETRIYRQRLWLP